MSLPLPEPQKECWIGHTLFSADQMHAYAAAAVEAEREQCALACEQRRDYEMQYARGSAAIAASDCADAIRARSKA